MDLFFTYILLCSNESYYVGHTSNLDERVKAHNSGKGSNHTSKFRPVKLLYYEEYQTEREAIIRELQLKKWSKPKKQALVGLKLPELRNLSKCRSRHGGHSPH